MVLCFPADVPMLCSRSGCEDEAEDLNLRSFEGAVPKISTDKKSMPCQPRPVPLKGTTVSS